MKSGNMPYWISMPCAYAGVIVGCGQPPSPNRIHVSSTAHQAMLSNTAMEPARNSNRWGADASKAGSSANVAGLVAEAEDEGSAMMAASSNENDSSWWQVRESRAHDLGHALTAVTLAGQQKGRGGPWRLEDNSRRGAEISRQTTRRGSWRARSRPAATRAAASGRRVVRFAPHVLAYARRALPGREAPGGFHDPPQSGRPPRGRHS